MKFANSRQSNNYYYDGDESTCELPNMSRASAGGRMHADNFYVRHYYSERRREKSHAANAFLITLISFLTVGFVFLFINAWNQSSAARASGVNTFQAVAEEMIPKQIVEAVTGTETGAGDAAGAGIDLTNATPTASSNIVSCDGQYVITDTAADDSVTFSFAGDILFDNSYAIAASINQKGGNIESAFDSASLDLMRSADVFCVNNEFPYSKRGTPTAGKKYTFRSDPAHVSWLQTMGVDMVELANNHAYDYGPDALTDTVETLDGIGMIHVGAGRNLNEASAPAYFYVDGMRIALINSSQIERYDNPETKAATDTTPGVFRSFDQSGLLQVISAAKSQSDFVVVLMHWGTEKTHEADWLQTSRLTDMQQAGADLIVGAHPHVLQGMTYVGDTPVIYSLGNYLFSSFTMDSGILQVTFQPSSKQMTQLRFVPMLQSNSTEKVLTGSEKQRVINELRSWSPGVNISDDGTIASALAQ